MVRKIRKAAVIGSGVMGGGIAALLASAGVKTIMLDILTPDLTDEEKSNPDARNKIVKAGLDTDSVADKIGGVFGPNDTFPKDSFAEIDYEFQHFGQSFLAGNNLQKSHVANRIKKVGPQKVLFELDAQALRHGLQRYTGCIRGNNGAFLSNRFEPF